MTLEIFPWASNREATEKDHVLSHSVLGLRTFKDGSNHNQHVVEQETALPSEPLCNDACDGTSYHTTHTEDSYSDRPYDGHFRLIHDLSCPVVFGHFNPVFDELQQKWGVRNSHQSKVGRTRAMKWRLSEQNMMVLMFQKCNCVINVVYCDNKVFMNAPPNT